MAIGYMVDGQDGARSVLGGYIFAFLILGGLVGFFFLVDATGPLVAVGILLLVIFLLVWASTRRRTDEIQITPEDDNASDTEQARLAKLSEVSHQLEDVTAQLSRVQGMLEQRRVS